MKLRLQKDFEKERKKKLFKRLDNICYNLVKEMIKLNILREELEQKPSKTKQKIKGEGK